MLRKAGAVMCKAGAVMLRKGVGAELWAPPYPIPIHPIPIPIPIPIPSPSPSPTSALMKPRKMSPCNRPAWVGL